jgi:hypothetical protein
MLEDWRFEYDWMVEQMRIRIGNPPPGVRYPVWAWHQWEGKRKKPDNEVKIFQNQVFIYPEAGG